jgi:hypothetical protein
VKRLLPILCLAAPLLAVRIPAGTELNVRLTDKVSTDAAANAKPGAVHAVLIAPVILDGAVAIASGAQLTGTIKQSKTAADKTAAQLDMTFTSMQDGAARAPIATLITSLDNARETVDNKGVINGIAPDATFSAQIDQGIAKLQSNDKLAGLAGLIQGAKDVLNIKDANPNIEYDAGVEFTLKVTQPFEWRGNGTGPVGKLQPIPNQEALAALVNRQPFRTMAANPPRPSDVTNLMFIATQEDLLAAFSNAGWSAATRLSTQSKLETARALIEARGYREGPMSLLLLDGKAPDMAWQKGNNTFAQRHHLRIFRRPDTFAGKPVWVCSSTHDMGIDFSERDRTFIHKVESEVDRERAKVVNDLLFTGMVKGLAMVGRPEVPTEITNATGDSLRTDGGMAVLLLGQ